MWINKRFYPLMDEVDDGTGGGGGGGNEFLSSLPEDLRDNPALQDIKDVGGLAKVFVDTKSMVGNSLRIPGDDAGEEQKTEFFSKLLEKVPNLMVKPDFDNKEQSAEFYKMFGVPESAEGYTAPEITVPDGIKFDPSTMDIFREMAIAANLSNEQFQKMVPLLADNSFKKIQTAMEEFGNQIDGLKEKWGSAFDQNYNIALNLAMKTNMPNEIIDELRNKTAEPSTVEWLHTLSKQFSSEGMNFNKENFGSDKITPDEAKEKISEINNNQQHPYWLTGHPDHASALEKMLKLQTAAFGG